MSKDWEELKELFIIYSYGDSDAVRPLFEDLKWRIELTLRGKSLKAEDIADISQQVLLKIHLSRERFDRTQPLKPWVTTIVHRTLIDFWRKNGGKSFTDISDIELPASDTSWFGLSPENVQNLRELGTLLGNLKPVDQRIVNMFAFDNKSIEDIGAELRLSPGAVKLRLHRARMFLKDLVPVILILLWGCIK